MEPSKQFFELIKQFTPLRLRAYKVNEKDRFYTIGYRHTGVEVKRRLIIPLEEAEAILRRDVAQLAELLNGDLGQRVLLQREYDALLAYIWQESWYAYRYSMLRYHVMCGSDPLIVAIRILEIRGVTFDKFTAEEGFWHVAVANHYLGVDEFTIDVYSDSNSSLKL